MLCQCDCVDKDRKRARISDQVVSKRRHYDCGDDLLRVPLYISTENLTDDECDHLLGLFADRLGATYFRDRALLIDVLNDYREAVQQPLSFLYGPYIGLVVNNKGSLRITATDKIPEACTVYTYAMIVSLINKLDVD